MKSSTNALALGFSFASCLALQRLIQAILDRPAVFGAGYDETVERAFQSDVSFLEMPTGSAQGRIIVKIARYYRPLLAIRSFEGIEAAINPVRSQLLPALHELSEKYDVSPKFSELFVAPSDAFRHTALVGLHLFYHDVKMVKVAFNATFGRSEDSWAQMIRLPEVIDKRQKFFEGYKLSVGYLWRALLGGEANRHPSIAKMLESTSWKEFNSCYKVIQSDIIDPIENDVDVFGGSPVFIVKSKVDEEFLERLSKDQGGDSIVQEYSDEEKLDRIFLGYPVRLVDHDTTASNTSGLIIALSGACSVTKAKVKVRRFVHGHHFSYALLIPASSNVADYSTWWLFYDFCSDDSGMGSAGYNEVEKRLQRLSDRLEVEEHRVNNLVLRDYSESHSEMAQFEADEPDFDPNDLGSIMGRKYSQSFRKRLQSSREEIGKLKGTTLELIVAVLMSRSGYRIAWGFQNSAILGDSEIDLLALRSESGVTEMVVMECTTAFDKTLLSETGKKMGKVANSMLDVAKQLHWTVNPESSTVKGLIVTTDPEKVPGNPLPSNMAVWYRKELLEICEANGMKAHMVTQMFPERNVPEVIQMSSIDDFSGLRDLLDKEED
ncbi:MAG TPA: hypothetical protein VGR53_08805 [Nitrososphaerales archaeon]|nr:hypothetical protein [Nitrososphaerales archaeon]